MEKKRELLPILNKAIITLSNMAPEIAKLEYHNNDKASRLVKQKIVDFRATELKDLHESISAIRAEINIVKTTKKTTEK